MASNLFRTSKHAMLYSKFRPTPPDEVIQSITKYCRDKVTGPFKQAVDIGCGSGQSTISFAPYFEKVIGYDISEAQIEMAKKDRSASNIEYSVADCYKLPLPDASVQLVVSSQAVHWFDVDKLFAEVKRILVPSGVCAVFGYWIPLPQAQDEHNTNKIKDIISQDLHDKHLGKYWNDERFIVKSHYADLKFPFSNIQRLKLVCKTESSLFDYINYFRTWSAYQKLVKENNERAEEILKDIEKQLLNILGPNKTTEEVKLHLNTDFFLLMGHN